jgi:hypothetical protein
MKKNKCIPVAEKKISLNIDDLPNWQPYSKVSSSHFHQRVWSDDERIHQSEVMSARERQDSWIKPPRGGHQDPPMLPDDLNISCEFKPNMSREAKGKVSLQIESQLNQGTKSFPLAKDNYQQELPPNLSATGKRPAGIGTENEQQEIIMAEKSENGVIIRVTLLAAGFIVGPNGASIHQIEAITGARIYSYNRSNDRTVARPSRQFHVEGPQSVVQHAVDIICHAIQLYKDLAEGNHRGMTVKRMHKLDNVLFRYEPPPRSKVPFAAQVEYDAAELRILQSTKGSRSIQAIRSVRQQLARRDEALMRAGLEAPVTKSRYVSGRGKSSGYQNIKLGEPDVQNHDIRQRQLIDEFDHILNISSRSTRSRSSFLNVRTHNMVKSAKKSPSGLDSRRDEGHHQQSNVATEVSITHQANARLGGYPQYLLKENNYNPGLAQGPPNNQSSGKWRKEGGLYGIDSPFFPRSNGN